MKQAGADTHLQVASEAEDSKHEECHEKQGDMKGGTVQEPATRGDKESLVVKGSLPGLRTLGALGHIAEQSARSCAESRVGAGLATHLVGASRPAETKGQYLS